MVAHEATIKLPPIKGCQAPPLRLTWVEGANGAFFRKENDMNLLRYQLKDRVMDKEPIANKIFLGGCCAELHLDGGCVAPENNTVWILDGVEITDTISVEVVNGQLLAHQEEDNFVYFLISGALGNKYNRYKRLFIPSGIELLAAGGKETCCNKISTVLLRAQKVIRRLVVGDMLYSQYSQAIEFVCEGKEWVVKVQPYDRFCATNSVWGGPWGVGESGCPVPLPMLVEFGV